MPLNQSKEENSLAVEPTSPERSASLSIALIPVAFLISLLSLNVFIFRDDAISGSNQVVLVTGGALAAALALWFGNSWRKLEDGILRSIKVAIPAILILLLVGALSGTWLISGIIPSMIYYGLQLMSPEFFLLATCVICALVSIFTGSSWTTSATIGIALMGIGKLLGVGEAMIAGAILSGAYFGDKLSPLSDTTNLASASSGSELFSHIRYMLFTTIPSISIALVAFTFLGLNVDSAFANADLLQVLQQLEQSFTITPWVLLVPAAVIAMILKQVPALPALFIGTLMGIICALVLQWDLIMNLATDMDASEWKAYIVIMQSIFGDISIKTGNNVLDDLLSSSGMYGMMGTIWLILSAMIFGGVMEGSGFLKIITQALLKSVSSIGGLVSTTAGTCLFINVSTADQYLAVLVPGRMFSDSFKDKNLAPENLSRTLEDSGTVTSVLIPWNTCGAYHASVLGVATLSYAPFVFFSLISPLLTILLAYFNIKIKRLSNN